MHSNFKALVAMLGLCVFGFVAGCNKPATPAKTDGTTAPATPTTAPGPAPANTTDSK